MFQRHMYIFAQFYLDIFNWLVSFSQVRFKVRTMTFTALSNSVKGITAVSTSETQDAGPAAGSSSSNSSSGGAGGAHNAGGIVGPPLMRRRSSSIGLSPEDDIPAVMQIIGNMNDFGLGLTSWW